MSARRLASHELQHPLSIIELSANNYDSTVSAAGMIVVQFWAPWCGPSRSFSNVFEQASNRHPQITSAKVDCDAQSELSNRLDVGSTPTRIVMRENIQVLRHSGALTINELEAQIAQLAAIDMNQMRADLEYREPDQG